MTKSLTCSIRIATNIMNNKTNIAELYGIKFNPYGDFNSSIATVLSFVNNFFIYMIKSVYIILGVFIIFNLIGHSVELHSLENILEAITSYTTFFHSLNDSWGTVAFFIIGIPLFVILLFHVIGFILTHLKLLLGLTFTNHFVTKQIDDAKAKKPNEFVNVAYEIYRPIYELMNIKIKSARDFGKSILVIGSMISIIVGTVAVVRKPREGFSEDTIIGYMDNQMAIRWVIIVILIIQLLLDLKTKTLPDILRNDPSEQEKFQSDWKKFRADFSTKTIDNSVKLITTYINAVLDQSAVDQMRELMGDSGGGGDSGQESSEGEENNEKSTGDKGEKGTKVSSKLKESIGKITRNNKCWKNVVKKKKGGDLSKVYKIIKDIEKHEKDIEKHEKDIEKHEKEKEKLEGEKAGAKEKEIEDLAKKIKNSEGDITKLEGKVNKILEQIKKEIKQAEASNEKDGQCDGFTDKVEKGAKELAGKVEKGAKELAGKVSGKK